MMNAFLEEFGNELLTKAHAVKVQDRASIGMSPKALKVPANVTLLHLPPKSRRNSIPRKICGTTCAATIGPTGSTRPGPISKTRRWYGMEDAS